MDKKISVLVLIVLISGTAGILTSAFLSSGSPAHAGILDDFINRLFKPQDSPLPVGTPAASQAPAVKRQDPPRPVYEAPVDYEEAIIKAVEKAAPGVISIVVTKDLPIIENCPFDPFEDLPPEFRRFFGPFEFNQPCKKGTKKQEVGGGSGFIVSSDGLILTNKHVVADTDASYTALTNDGKKYDIKILARDPAQDLAVAKITNPGGSLPVLNLGNSDSIRLGQTAIAIGNALGEFRNTVSVGIISGLARSIDASGGGQVEHLEGLIQTDAAINPGNSGGPLLNLRGEVIGINTAVAQGAENVGFAIPINQAKRDIDSVKKTGKISIPFLGVRYIVINEEIAKRDELPVTQGVIVRGSEDGPGVIPDSPAEKAGIQAEDIILEINGEKITAERTLASLIQKYGVSERVNLKVLRAGKEITVAVTLGERQS
ncbi:MAG TPA: trypsin-like peptidase domain-containing protein [Candidatus Paceibacterota bacterium]